MTALGCAKRTLLFVSKAGTGQPVILLKEGLKCSLINQSLTNHQKKGEEDQNIDEHTE